jgi:selenium donor protein
MFEILRGGSDKMKEAGCAIIGGHSINDPQVKAGFAVTGLIDKNHVVTNAAARPGDVLILTKPLGTGIVAFAAQIDRARPESVRAAAASMTSLNKTAAELMIQFGAHAATDVTGFSLMGHLAEMARSSGVDVEIVWTICLCSKGCSNTPLPHPPRRDRAEQGVLRRPRGRSPAGLLKRWFDICFDAQPPCGS